METLRVYRPRVVLHGPVGMGQNYVGTAALHYLEGYHVQNLDLGTLLSDSTRVCLLVKSHQARSNHLSLPLTQTNEAAIVQLFVEAKRHQPSIIYIPSLLGWCSAVSETCRSTLHAMLETLAPTDPILLLAIVDGSFMTLPRDVRAWFGLTRENRVEITRPGATHREAFFDGLLKDVQRPPNQFPDGLKRKRRVLEELPLAPPLEPRQPTAAELAMQQENDHRLITLLRFRLGPILTELKRKFKRFTKPATVSGCRFCFASNQRFSQEEYRFPTAEQVAGQPPQSQPVDSIATTLVNVHEGPNGVLDVAEQPTEIVTHAAASPAEQSAPQIPQPPPTAERQPTQVPHFYDMDLERMHVQLHKNRYLTPQDFLDDVGKMVHNAVLCHTEDLERLHRAQAMYTATEVSIQDFDLQFRTECERMAVRERQRRSERKKEREKAKEQEADAAGETYAPGTRRSARHNGQQPEIAITDVTKLERAARLKRQRSTGLSGGSQASGDEISDGRDVKRSRVNSEEDVVMDSVEPCSSQHASVYVSCPQTDGPQTDANSVNPNGRGGLLPDVPPAAMGGGFDPSLLNPAPPHPDQSPYRHFFSPSSTPVDVDPSPLAEDPQPLPPPLSPHPTEQASSSQLPLASPPAILNTDESLASVTPIADELPANAPPVPPPPPELEPVCEPIEVDREPTPLPDFHLNQDALMHLRRDLRDMTDLLSVEQLEQLRASCLGRIWAHRSDWDRNNLIDELGKLLRDFVDEVRADFEGNMPVSPATYNS
jgi:ATPase family AAA domain-containing protein 2